MGSRPRILSGSELVAKGATRKVDGQLPQVGLKEVLPDNSWLEQKQIQSTLEARKHLIAVERIEKSGSLSHAEWRDDLNLAEVTKQVGGHWQYLGHKKGKHLYLLPEEALFLIEINSLLLKHNGVTVSLQKAYALCLREMPLSQYKVYASLSRLGYRVCRHKEPKSDDKSNMQNITEGIKIKRNDIGPEVSQQISSDSMETEEKSDNGVDSDIRMVGKDENMGDDAETDIQLLNQNKIQHEAKRVNCTHIDSTLGVKNKMEIENDTMNKTVQNDTSSSSPNDKLNGISTHDDQTKIKEKPSLLSACDSTMAVDENIDEADETSIENNKNKLKGLVVSQCENVSDNVINAVKMDKDVNETALVVCGNKESTSKQEIASNINIASETLNAVISGVVYSVDESGVIRPTEKRCAMETASCDVANVPADPTQNNRKAKAKNTSTDESLKHYQKEIKHFDEKILKLTERKSSLNQTSNHEGLDMLQDLYKERIVNVNVPEEKYLPRNIFLHRTSYRLNMDAVRNQNASNVSSDEMDSAESPSKTPVQNAAEPPQYARLNTNHMSQPRYPHIRVERHPQFLRENLNYMFRQHQHNIHNLFAQPRWRMPHAFIRHQYMANNMGYNMHMPGVHIHNQANRRDQMKTYHYSTIVSIVNRFKSGVIASPSQIRALHSLLNTYNLRYNTHLGVTQDFIIIDTKNQPQPPQVETVVVSDDEPKTKKKKLNDDSETIKINLEKLKELAAKLEDLHSKNLATSRHRRVFSNAINTFNKSFKADHYLNSNFEIVDRKLVILDSSSDSDAVVVKEKSRPKKRKKLRNPYSILKHVANNNDASTSRQVPVLQTLSPNVINEKGQDTNNESHSKIAPVATDRRGLLKYFDKAWLPNDDDFGRAELCSRQSARLDALLFQAEYLHDVLKESLAEFESWKDIKLTILKDMRGTLDIQKQQTEALSNDFYMTESDVQPIVGPECTDLKSALKKLAMIPTNIEIPAETSLRVHFDVWNRDVPFKKTNPPKPNFRVVCYEESAIFPSSEDVAALQAKYVDGVPTVFAFVGISASISYLQINPTNLPVYIPEQLA